MKIIGKLILLPLLTINIAVSVLTILSCYVSQLAPFGKWPFASLSGLAFPYLAGALLLFLILWLIFWRKAALVPAVTFIVCIGPILEFSPMHFRAHTPREESRSFVMMTYNTMGFGIIENKDRSSSNPVARVIAESGADIICLQEAITSDLNDFTGKKGLFKDYPYIMSGEGMTGQTIMSKYPIIKSSTEHFENSTGNCYQHSLIKFGSDTISVYNCHFQSNHMDPTNLEDYNKILRNPSDTANIDGMKKILKKLLESTGQRAEQTRMIADMVRSDKHTYKIVCGDFNDSPLSYSHRIFDRFMTDSWTKAGFGPGITYHSHNLYYRIDHIFCSRNMTPLSVRRDTSTKDSDHYPVICSLEL